MCSSQVAFLCQQRWSDLGPRHQLGSFTFSHHNDNNDFMFPHHVAFSQMIVCCLMLPSYRWFIVASLMLPFHKWFYVVSCCLLTDDLMLSHVAFSQMILWCFMLPFHRWFYVASLMLPFHNHVRSFSHSCSSLSSNILKILTICNCIWNKDINIALTLKHQTPNQMFQTNRLQRYKS